jgi:hypothetical protein
MVRRISYTCVLFLSATSLLAQQPVTSVKPQPSTPESAVKTKTEQLIAPSEPRANLPVRRVVLYKNGVGYFEHHGQVRGSQDVHIDFTSAQLNDILKSLTVLDLSGGRITGVDFFENLAGFTDRGNAQ